ncbi:Transglutaminase-like superfamily protein [Botrimarina hoheduenensis]|uniref:Transglutaminase-like superfamily protein n=2 Tax=Botrimarina hoheduenensis TaxID=2528000 RepID=A0A5C5VZJ6_9BACT|nr:Transglutaminase-like superfamily protein [Botrimarina hoheduenensis]
MLGGMIVGGGLMGCGGADESASRDAAERRSRQRQAAQTDALLESIASQLRTLPEAVQLDLTPPTVVVDSRSSTDGEDIEAVIVRPDGVPPEAPANLLRVPRRNARFRAADVRPDDTIKYFARIGRETQDRLREAGDADIVVMEAFEFRVAQVLSDNDLLIVGGLSREVDTPFRLEVWRNVDDRMEQISSQLAAYARRRDPPVGWQPSPDEAELRQLHERVNQWLRQSGGVSEGRQAEIKRWLKTLPSLEQADPISDLLTVTALAQGPFLVNESREIQQAVWCRDIARRVRGNSASAADQAAELFDWVVRNVALMPSAEASPNLPWEAMLHGRGSAEQRAWVFALLCRQAELTPFVLSVTETNDTTARTLVGVVEGVRAVLFDPQLGLPVSRQPGSPRADASLAELIAEPSILRGFDLPDSPYPVTAEALVDASAWLVAEPFALTGRAAALEKRFSGRDSLVLTVDLEKTAAAVSAALPPSLAVKLWEHPFETLRAKHKLNQGRRNRDIKEFLPFAWRPPLWKGRVLSFRGVKEDAAPKGEVLADPQDDLRAAQVSFMDRTLRPKDKLIATVSSDVKRDIYRRAKVIATYWLATTALERGDYRNAISWLGNSALIGPDAEELRESIRYTRARAYEALGETATAAETLGDSASAQRHGDQLRARWLREATADGSAPNANAPANADETK